MFQLELDRAVAEIRQRGSKIVMIQLPDGLKWHADKIVDEIESKTGAQACIWFGSCFGACDIPLGLENLGVDLMIQWGHNRYHKTEQW
jgi:2-(3-amino-3-carboxypropyl)histidine synthase